MKRLLFATAMLGIATLAQAQYGPDGHYRPNGAYAPDSVSALIDRTHNDLNRAYGVWNFSGHDRGRLNHAEERLRDFAQKWHRGKFDRGELDDCIGSVQHILDRNQLPYRERAALDSDVGQLPRHARSLQSPRALRTISQFSVTGVA